MDPNACWTRIEEAIIDHNRGELGDACADLLAWLNKGGGLLPDALISRGFNLQSATYYLLTVRQLANHL